MFWGFLLGVGVGLEWEGVLYSLFTVCTLACQNFNKVVLIFMLMTTLTSFLAEMHLKV